MLNTDCRDPVVFSRIHIHPRTVAAAVAALTALAAAPPGGAGRFGPGPRPARAQEAPYRGLPVEGGVTETALLLRGMGGVRRVLVIGAHPDDEDTALLAELARHEGVRAAYFSLTRGEGGQDLIGPELGKGLGLIRTEELLAARRVDGAEQYFSRAYDFGFSKTAKESFGHWPADTLLGDMVWVIRTFRPQVIVSVFSGTPADGHGQHQVAGILARKAFEAAADSSRFPEQLRWGARPWQAEKLYRRAFRRSDSSSMSVSTGDYDPVLGMSPFQLAMLSRSQHRSQDMGVLRPPGSHESRLLLLRNRTGAAPDAWLFAGIDTSVVDLANGLPVGARGAARRRLTDYAAAVRAARDSLRALDPGAATPPLLRAVTAISEVERAADAGADPATRAAVRRQADLARRALRSAAGVTLHFRAEEDTWVPGETVRIDAELWNGGADTVMAGPPELDLPEGWSARLLPKDSAAASSGRSGFYPAPPALGGGSSPLPVRGGQLARWAFDVHVPADAAPTEEYFLRQDTVGDLYRWPADPDLRARPLDPPVVSGRLPLRVAGVPAPATEPVRYRGVDKSMGEFWRPVYVVPRVSVSVEPRVVVWPISGGPAGGPTAATSATTARREVAVTVRSEAGDTLGLDVGLDLPTGWSAEPATATVTLDEHGATETRAFDLRPPDEPAGGSVGRAATGGPEPALGPDSSRTYRIMAVARPAGGSAVGAGPWSRGLTMLDFAHIDPVPLYRDATVRVERFPVRVDRSRRVGYVMGSGDAVPEAIRQLGLDVHLIGPDELRSGDLSAYDVIVLGVRAYEVRHDLQAANQRLLDWVRAGGTLIVQYNKYEYVNGGYPPYPATMAHPHDRVTDERAPVTLLHPDAPPLATPNRIGPDDWRGWIQERGLYFLHSWDERYTPLLSMHDAGESPKEGSLLVASLGQGVYVYAALDFFRELPAGVPGAYRLFANLLSLKPEAWRAWREGHPAGSP